MSQRDAYHSTPVVADRLGLSSQMVRRYQIAYEAVTARRLPRDPSTRSRLIDDDELAIFEKARDLVKHDDSVSVKDALRQCLSEREDAVLEAETPRVAPSLEERLAPVRERLSAFGHDLTSLRGGIEAVQAKIADLVGGATRRDERLEHLERTVAEQSDELGALRDELSRLRSEPSPAESFPKPSPKPSSANGPVVSAPASSAPTSSEPPASAPRPSEATPDDSRRERGQDHPNERNDRYDERDHDPLWLVSWLWKI